MNAAVVPKNSLCQTLTILLCHRGNKRVAACQRFMDEEKIRQGGAVFLPNYLRLCEVCG